MNKWLLCIQGISLCMGLLTHADIDQDITQLTREIEAYPTFAGGYRLSTEIALYKSFDSLKDDLQKIADSAKEHVENFKKIIAELETKMMLIEQAINQK